jgi:hypothetical protein
VDVAYPTVSGHPWARITPFVPDEAATFGSIIQVPNARVYIQGDVNLDVSGLSDVPVAAGVQIIGERDAAHPNGPRLFSTSAPKRMLLVGDDDTGTTSDNVRITGVRFDGMESSDPCDNAGLENDSDAVFVYASRGVLIDHNESYHWRGAAVNVQDNDDVAKLPTGQQRDRINRDSGPSGVWVLNNYIHDDQHPAYCGLDPFGKGHGAGYGVEVDFGGYAYIQGDVFTNDRHAINGNGSNGDGYTAIGNLFLHPSVDDVRGDGTHYNHFIDMHGLTRVCTTTGESYACGQAGLSMEVANNVVASNLAAAVQLRGTPSSYNAATQTGEGMYVHDNVFDLPQRDSLTQTEQGLVVGSGNQFAGVDATSQANLANQFTSPYSTGLYCDLDGDGAQDPFRDLAGTMWYYSTRLSRWVYMATNNVSSSGLSFGDRNGEGCATCRTRQGLCSPCRRCSRPSTCRRRYRTWSARRRLRPTTRSPPRGWWSAR